jgi:hypothetical protein
MSKDYRDFELPIPSYEEYFNVIANFSAPINKNYICEQCCLNKEKPDIKLNKKHYYPHTNDASCVKCIYCCITCKSIWYPFAEIKEDNIFFRKNGEVVSMINNPELMGEIIKNEHNR